MNQLREQVEAAFCDFDPTPRRNDPTKAMMAAVAIAMTLAAVAEELSALPTRTAVDDDQYRAGKRPWPIAVDRYRDDVLAAVARLGGVK